MTCADRFWARLKEEEEEEEERWLEGVLLDKYRVDGPRWIHCLSGRGVKATQP